MDTGEGYFRQATDKEIEKAEALEPVSMNHFFGVGEQVEIRGSHFKVAKITPKKLILRLLPRVST